jgi:hypothetical protein
MKKIDARNQNKTFNAKTTHQDRNQTSSLKKDPMAPTTAAARSSATTPQTCFPSAWSKSETLSNMQISANSKSAKTTKVKKFAVLLRGLSNHDEKLSKSSFSFSCFQSDQLQGAAERCQFRFVRAASSRQGET